MGQKLNSFCEHGNHELDCINFKTTCSYCGSTKNVDTIIDKGKERLICDECYEELP